MHSSTAPRGITVIEILVAVSIVGLMGTVVLAVFGEFRSRQTLNAVAETTLAAFSAAHLDTISSKDDATYGVYLKRTEAIYFRGATYPGDNDPGNVHYALPSTIEIVNINLHGGGSTVFYKQLSGATDNYGTFDVRVAGNTDIRMTITINQTGATSV